MNAPLDETHAMCLNARNRIRTRLAHFRATVVDTFEIRPCPPDWKKPTR